MHRIDFALANQRVGDGNAAVRDFPAGGFLAENEHQAGGLPRENVVFDRQVNGKATGGDGDRCSQRLDGQVLEFESDRVFNLGEVLTGNGDPLLPVFDQEIPPSGQAGKVLAETGGQPIIARAIQPHVVVKELPDFLVVAGVHWAGG